MSEGLTTRPKRKLSRVRGGGWATKWYGNLQVTTIQFSVPVAFGCRGIRCVRRNP